MTAITISSVILICYVIVLVVCEPLSDWYPGIATHFQGPQDLGYDSYDPKVPAGSCGYDELDPKLYPFWGVASLSSFSPMVAGEKLAGCGACFQVECLDLNRCTGRTTTNVLITDSCAGCVQQQLNMHVFSFQYLANSKWGELPIRFRRIECQPPKDILIRITNYRANQGGWIRLVLLDIAGKADVATVQLKSQNNSNWLQMQNLYGAAWELSGVPAPPFDLRVTLTDGQYVVIENQIQQVRIGGLYESKAQFNLKSGNNEQMNRNGVSLDNVQGKFPVLSMPPVDGSAISGLSPVPLTYIAQTQQRFTFSQQVGKPEVSLESLLNPGITVGHASSRLESETSDVVQSSDNVKYLNNTNSGDTMILNLYQQQNNTDWNYLRQQFLRIGLIEPAAEQNS